MKIKSLKQLNQVRKNELKKIRIRHLGETEGQNTRVTICIGDAGLAAGSRNIINHFFDLIDDRDLPKIRIVQADHTLDPKLAPIVLVQKPDREEVIFINVTEELATEIIEDYILKDIIPQNAEIMKEQVE